MAKIAITGGGGMIGQKIARRLMDEGFGGRPLDKLSLIDVAFPESSPAKAERITGSLANAKFLVRIAADRPDVVIHLAAVLSGQSEQEFDLGWSINMGATRLLLEALRLQNESSSGGYRPRFVFASSVAAFGPPFPSEPIGDQFICEPRTSYGTQKAICELMISDYSRKGFVDGVSLRLPTITVRPGKPNSAASSCFSSIIREPLNGQEAMLPLSPDVKHMHASPRSAAGFFLHAAAMDTGPLDDRRSLTMPSLTCSIQDQIDALRSYAGESAVALIKCREDPLVQSIVSNWAESFNAERARELGFVSEWTFDEILQAYVDDDLPAATPN